MSARGDGASPAVRRLAAGVLLAAAALLLSRAAGADPPLPFEREVAGSAEKLDTLRRQIRGLRGDLSELAGRRQDADQDLRQVTREIGLVRELLAGLDQREAILTLQRDSLRTVLAAQRETHELRRRNLAARLRTIYKQGPQRDLELILTAESYSALVTRLKFRATLTRLDGNLVQQTRRQGQRLEAEERQMQTALAGIWEAREEVRLERERLELLEAERRALLREATEEHDRTESELARLQRQAKDLEQLLGRLEVRREQAADDPAAVSREGRFLARQGTLPWPASGTVVRDYGRSVHPRFGTVTMHNGLTIAVTSGAPIYAVADGKVEFAEHLPGFGRCVILDHGSGHYTLYANLSRIFVGRGHEVAEGQILAEMGEGGESGRPELYFEVREGREARNPRQWLRPPS